MGRTTDPLAAALAALPISHGGNVPLLDRYFKDRPDVLDAIRAAYERGVSCKVIARLVAPEQPAGTPPIAGDTIGAWCRNQGLTHGSRIA